GTVLIGELLSDQDSSCQYMKSGVAYSLDELFYIPTGSYFFWNSTSASNVTSFDCVIQDLPASAGPE
ncbi:unnamed protein product, partial [marine sediment metagenome]